MTMTSLGEAVLEVFRHWLTEHHRQFVENTQKLLYFMRRRLILSELPGGPLNALRDSHLPGGHFNDNFVRFAMNARRKKGPGL